MFPSSDTEVEMNIPLLQDDELSPDEPHSESSTVTNFDEEPEHVDSQPLRASVKNYFSWKGSWNWMKKLPVRRPRTRTRVLAFIGVGAFVALLLVLIAMLFSWNSSEETFPVEDETLANDIRLEKYQTPSDAQFCSDWSESTELSSTSSASFELSPFAALVFFLTRGNQITGNFILHSERVSSSDKITVDVVAQYDDSYEGREELKKTKACLAGQDNDERGILLWADPGSPTSYEHVKFNISVHLPSINGFSDLSTDFTNSVFTHLVGSFFDLWNPTGFGAVRLNARNAPITVQSIMAISNFIHTTNAEIRADIWSNKTIQIQTSNAPIISTIASIGQTTGEETSVSIRTNNAPIFAIFSMVSRFPRTSLRATVQTFSSPLQLALPRPMLAELPILTLDASTSRAPAAVLLSPDFEGAFDLQTTGPRFGFGFGWGGKAAVNWDRINREPDPTGGGRERVVRMDGGLGMNERRHKKGRMYWNGSEKNPEKSFVGDVRVRTTRKDVMMN